MSFNIRSVCLYRATGERRTVRFNPSGLSILTGKAKTGKSAIIDVIDYCLGRANCYVAEGVIRDHVSWFGVEVFSQQDVLFVARRNPRRGKIRSDDICVRRGIHSRLPSLPELAKNTNLRGLVQLLSRFAGIADNEHEPVSGSRPSLRATIRHALFLCVQKQDEIASQDRLFHRQGDQFVPQAIKDAMPYFLGAVDAEHLLLRAELRRAKKELASLERQKKSATHRAQATRVGLENAVREAQRVGLLGTDLQVLDDVEQTLRSLQRVTESDVRLPTAVFAEDDVVADLEAEMQGLRRELRRIHEDAQRTSYWVREESRFADEVNEQKARLRSLELFQGAEEVGASCPLCESTIPLASPTTADLLVHLGGIERQLTAVGIDRQYLEQKLESLGEARGSVEERLVRSQAHLEQAYADSARLREQRDQAIERARTVGKISAYLEQFTRDDEVQDLDGLILSASRRIEAIRERIDADAVGQRVDTFLNLISEDMTKFAASLELEHAEGRIRLDLGKLSVVADTVAGPISLDRMGSGENWVGYHVITLLALHRWFRSQDRPVPGVLILDQPSQAHYPPEGTLRSTGRTVPDADRRAVRSLFRFMYDISHAIGRGFQLIVLDHAHLDDSWFGSSIVEEWRGEQALIPVEWQEDS